MILQRIRKNVIKITNGLVEGAMVFVRDGIRFIAPDDLAYYRTEKTFLGSLQMRAMALTILGTSSVAMVVWPLFGASAALSPVMLADATTALSSGTIGTGSTLQGVLAVIKDVFSIPGLATQSPVTHHPLQAASQFATTAQAMSLTLGLTPIFSGLKYPSIMGNRVIRDQKSSKNVFNNDFSKLVADEIEDQIRQQNEEDYGVRYEKGDARPAQGAFAIVPDQNAAIMLDVLVQNGLSRFEDGRVAIDFTIKDVVVKPGDKNYVTKIPTSSELLLRKPKRKGWHAEIDFRTLLVDPRFVDESGKPLYKELPKRYIKAVLNNFNPMMLYGAYVEELDDLLSRAGDQGEAFGKIIKYVAQQWKDKQTPDDKETLQEVISMGMLHEFTHALALHLPDYIPADASAETRRDLAPITFDKYLELVMNDNDLITSVAFNKNLFKALREVKDKDPSVKTQGTINATVALEMFCDRFSMFLYQNYIKIQIYSEIFKDAKVPFSVDIDAMLHMETQRRAGQLREMRGLKDVLGDEDFSRLETELDAADKSHYFVSKFGDSALKASEIEFFEKFLYLLKHFDTEKMIMRFTMEHANNSRFMRASITGLTSPKALGVKEVVEVSDDLGELAVNTFNCHL